MKILSAEYNLDSPTIISYASVVRLYNGDSSNILVTRKATGGTVIGNFIVPAGEVVYCEKDYTDTLEANANVKASKTAFSPMMRFVGPSVSGPTYTYSLSATNLNEGGSFTTTVTTTNVDDGTVLYWELSGVGIDANDFTSGALTGSGTISSDTFNFSHTINEDATTEGVETVNIKLYTDSGRNTQVGNTVTVTIADTSLTRTYSISVSASAGEADEGDTFTTTMTTANVADGTVLYWEFSGTGIAAGDFSSGALTGSGTISSNTFNFSHTLANDVTTEGTESLLIKFYSDSGRTTQVGSTTTVNINDTSVAPVIPPGEWSSVFTGSNYLTAPVSGGALNSSEYTYECWIYPTGIGGNAGGNYLAFLSRWKAGHYCFILEVIKSTGNLLVAWGNGSSYQGQAQWASLSNNTWYHIALVRNGTSGKVYVNGVEKMSVTIPENSTNATEPVYIGTMADGNPADYGFVGRITDVRLVNGQALYNSNFTPPTTPLTNVSSCKLLCCKDKDPTMTVVNRLNGSPYGQDINNTGSVTTTSVDPYTYNHYFDGNGDYLSIPSSSDWNIMGGDFTLEVWLWRSANLGWSGILSQWEYGNYNVNNSWVFESVGSTMSFYYANTAGAIYNADGPSALSLNTWQHIAATKSGSTLNVWIDGVKGADHTIVGTPQSVSVGANIGGNVAGSGWYQGYMTDLKLTKGQALYTGNFTPSTELTLTSDGSTDSNVKLMCMDQPTPTAYTRSPGTISIPGNVVIPSYRSTTGP